jgi:hypothetical protein
MEGDIYCGLIYISLIASDVHFFHKPVGHLSSHTLCSFYNWIVCFLTIELLELLCILDNRTLSDVWLENIFSYSIGCLFILLIVCLALQKLFILI